METYNKKYHRDDGDQVTVKIVWSQEGNDECEKFINRKDNFLAVDGSLIRKMGNEGSQTMYSLTKHPIKTSRKINAEETNYLLSLQPEDFTFEKLVSIFGHRLLSDKNEKPKFIPEDLITLPIDTCCKNKEKIDTTVGRYVFNRIIVEGCGLIDQLGYVNNELSDKAYKKLEAAIANASLQDKISPETLRKYINARDWLGYQLHAVITISFTLNTITIHPEVEKLKKELLKKYAKELAENDPIITGKIEAELIKKTEELLRDDVGMDLYYSGARGSLGNNYKNIALMRGAVYNRQTGGYDIVTNSLNDGLAIKDIPASANTVMEGAFPKAV